MDNNNTYLDCLINAITEKKEMNMDFEYPKWYDKWYEFRYLTDVGFMIAHNEYFEYRGPSNDNEVKGAFFKIDDNLYAQISIYNVEKTKKTNVHIDIFNVSELTERINVAFEHLKDDQFNMYMTKSEVEETIKNFDPFEIIVRPLKRR